MSDQDATRWITELDSVISIAEKHGVRVTPGAAERVARFCAEVEASSRQINLVSRSDLQYLVEKHIAASLGLALVEDPVSDRRWIDVGTGAGFPGLALKLFFPGCQMTLLESSAKKTAFLEHVRNGLGLADMRIIRARVEELGVSSGPRGKRAGPGRRVPRMNAEPPVQLDSYDRIIMRAVASIGQCFDWIEGISRPGSRLLTYKGPDWKTELSEARATPAGKRWSFLGVHEIPWAKSRILSFQRRK